MSGRKGMLHYKVEVKQEAVGHVSNVTIIMRVTLPRQRGIYDKRDLL